MFEYYFYGQVIYKCVISHSYVKLPVSIILLRSVGCCESRNFSIYLGVSINGGTPPNGWFISWKIQLKWKIQFWGYPYDSRNLHLEVTIPVFSPPYLAMSATCQVALPDDLLVRVAVSGRFEELLRQSEEAWNRGWRTDVDGRSRRVEGARALGWPKMSETIGVKHGRTRSFNWFIIFFGWMQYQL